MKYLKFTPLNTRARMLAGAPLCALLCALLAATVLPPSVQAAQPHRRAPVVASSADLDFIALREASLRGDTGEAGRLSARLIDYPVPSYVESYRLYPRLPSAPEGEIRAFLNKYDGTAIADRLRNDWLLLLGRARDWRLFERALPLMQAEAQALDKALAALLSSPAGA